ncbi:PE-PGRS family protein PE_PGRS5-like [Helianthus annuus]|uniref:PE-PGRS family protein PE_PGRS5-like n=1 Tax=Helianthus annuus TaxID=4232 RepID=UPI000B8F0ADB|nr:PE-PGRS family protein PE_PGRS5-like [Helianthus annuus]
MRVFRGTPKTFRVPTLERVTIGWVGVFWGWGGSGGGWEVATVDGDVASVGGGEGGFGGATVGRGKGGGGGGGSAVSGEGAATSRGVLMGATSGGEVGVSLHREQGGEEWLEDWLGGTGDGIVGDDSECEKEVGSSKVDKKRLATSVWDEVLLKGKYASSNLAWRVTYIRDEVGSKHL